MIHHCGTIRSSGRSVRLENVFARSPRTSLDSRISLGARLRTGRGRLRSLGPDYLFYNLLDSSIDGFYPVLEALGHRLEALEEQVIERPRQELVGLIHAVRRDIMALRHAVWPLREAVGRLYREEHELVQDETRVYYRDAYDHTVQVIDLLENYREMGSALLEVYLSSVGYRTNQVMKVLTIIATIFIPLTFIAGVYGMNFDHETSPWNMPELRWYFGYPLALLSMLVTALGLIFFFRRKGWLGANTRSRSGPRTRE
jgi:magnesium transporter